LGSNIYLDFYSSSLDSELYNLLFTRIIFESHKIADSDIRLPQVTDKSNSNERYSSNSASPRISKGRKTKAFSIKPITGSVDVSIQSSIHNTSKTESSCLLRITGSITGDDILIEYMKRLLIVIKSYGDARIDLKWEESLRTFILHTIWKGKIDTTKPLFEQLKCRVKEMLQKKRQMISLVKADSKKEQTTRPQLISSLPNEQLEYLLRRSLRNKSFEVFSGILFSDSNDGILIDLTKKRIKSSALEKRKNSLLVNG
jgi:hypothetical protein